MNRRWFEEIDRGIFGIKFRVDNLVYEGESKYQKILIFDNEHFGRVFVLDDCVMCTQRDEFFYHEMLVHVPLISHPNPKKVLIIGGGDGGSLREAVKHPEVEEVVMCEIDEQVIELAREHLKYTSCEFDNPKARIISEDGFKFVKEHPQEFDVILVDGTDPIGPGMVLFTPEFFELGRSALKPNGIFAQQTGSALYYPEHFKEAYQNIRQVFKASTPYVGPTPTYPSGYWTYCFCQNGASKLDILSPSLERIEKLGELKYYTPEIHKGAFNLPGFIKNTLKS